MGIWQILCPFPYNLFTVYPPRTPALVPSVCVLSEGEGEEEDAEGDRVVVGTKRALRDSPSKVSQPSKKSKKGKGRDPKAGMMQASSKRRVETPVENEAQGPYIDLSDHKFPEDTPLDAKMLPLVGKVVSSDVAMSRC